MQGFGPSGFPTHVINASGVCLTAGFGRAPERVASFLNAVTGFDQSPEEVLQTGERMANLRHAFNLREGINPLELTVHPRILGDPPQEEGPLAGVRVDIEAQAYWNLGALDWDRVTTKPNQKKLLQLGLSDVAEDLYPQE